MTFNVVCNDNGCSQTFVFVEWDKGGNRRILFETTDLQFFLLTQGLPEEALALRRRFKSKYRVPTKVEQPHDHCK